MRVRDIVLHVGGYQNANQTVDQAMADAQEAAYQLRSGAALDQVMQHFSLVDSGRTKGGDEFDFAAKLHLGDKLFAVAATLTSGEISDPVVEGDGVHIVMMEERRAPRPAGINASRGTVYADYRTDQQLHARAENLKFLRSNAQILLAPGQRE
jgi:parvulin-like peptidyl-prolyl isomerase